MGSTMVDTAPIETAEDSLSYPRLLGSSISSLSSRRPSNPLISRAYKQASNLFLTRRLQEALSALESVITAPKSSDQVPDENETPKRAPIASASRSSRIKVWSLYLTLLNAIVELGPEDGKAVFGNRDWNNIVAKTRDGSIWEEVVQTGYGGVEGNADAEVVINLATLLLSQSSCQTTNQQRLESYLSASSEPNLDLTGQFDASNYTNGYANSRVSHDHGTNTPRDLASRIKVLELFTLHVLPRNEGWAYARDIITTSAVLDEARRDTFLQALQGLENEKSRDAEYDANEAREREREREMELERQRAQDERRKVAEAQAAEEQRRSQQQPWNHRRIDSEKDYGIDSSHPTPTSAQSPSALSKNTLNPVNKAPPKPSRSPPRNTHPRKITSTSIYKRSVATVAALQQLISNMALSMSKNPMLLLRFVLFLLGIVVALSRRDVKDRVARITGSGWDKVKRTVGMGVKVSYI